VNLANGLIQRLCFTCFSAFLLWGVIGKVFSVEQRNSGWWFGVITVETIIAVSNLWLWDRWCYWRLVVAAQLASFMIYHILMGNADTCGCTGVFNASGGILFTVSSALFAFMIFLSFENPLPRSSKQSFSDLFGLFSFLVICFAFAIRIPVRSISSCKDSQYLHARTAARLLNRHYLSPPVTVIAGNLNCSKCCDEIAFLLNKHIMNCVDVKIIATGATAESAAIERFPPFADFLFINDFEVDVHACESPLEFTVLSYCELK